VPDGVSVLAKSDVCPIQAIRYGAHAYGVQFHLEATASTVADWAAVPEYAAALDRAMGQGATGRLEAEVARKLPAFNASARTIYENFKALSGW
jgi:GMP synthase-like glutamine amidotransferase